MKMSLVFYLSILFTLVYSCTEKINIETERTNVKSVLDQYLKAWESNSIDIYSEIISHDNDMVNIWTMAPDRFVGWDELKEKFQEPVWFKDNKFEVNNQVIKVHSSGKVAWFSEIINWDFIAQDQQMSLKGMRFTGVIEKQNDKWIFVQTHFSMPEQ